MSTNKHIDKICIAAVAITLVITLLFMNGSSLGIVAAEKNMGYESRLFDTSKVHTLDIVMNDWDSFITNCESEEYSSCTVIIDGEAYKNVALRAKGNTSLSNVSSMGSQRYSFKIEFDHYDDGKSYYGLDKLCLNNLIQDNTMMKDYLAYQLMDSFGVDAPLSSYVYITVNGEDWGLYLAVEAIEDSFLTRNYGSDIGDLYKPDTLNFGAGRGNGKDFNMDDFTAELESSEESSSSSSDSSGSNTNQSSQDSGFGTPPNMPQGGFSFGGDSNSEGGFSFGGNPPQGGFSFGGDNSQGGFSFDGDTDSDGGFDISAIVGGNIGNMFGGMGSDDVKLKYIDDNPESYANIFDSAKTTVTKSDKTRLISSLKNLTEYTNLEDVLDMDEVLRYFVVHTFLCNGDSYTGSMIHNYYLHEDDGKLSMIPWDYNLAYGTFMGGDASSSVNASIDNPISGGSVDDRPMVGWIFSDEEYTNAYHDLYESFIAEWFTSGKLEAMIQETAEMIRPYVEKDPTKFCTTEEFETGVEVISQFMDLRAEAVTRQLNGDDTAVETNGLNLSDMGSMGGTNSFGGDRGNFGGFGDRSDSGTSEANAPENVTNQTGSDRPTTGNPGNFGDFGGQQPGFPSNNAGADAPSGTSPSDGSTNAADGGDSSSTDANNGSFSFGNGNGTSRPDQNFDGQSFDFSKGGQMNVPEGLNGSTPSQLSNWIWVAISFIVLIVGIIIARKKKY